MHDAVMEVDTGERAGDCVARTSKRERLLWS